MCHTLSFQLCLLKAGSLLCVTWGGGVACIYLCGQPTALHPEQSTESTAGPGSAGLLWQECIRGVTAADPSSCTGNGACPPRGSLALPPQQGEAVQKTPPKLWDHK